MKYNEDKILKEIGDYIKSTYGQHYAQVSKRYTGARYVTRYRILIKIFAKQTQSNICVGLVRKQVVIEKTY